MSQDDLLRTLLDARLRLRAEPKLVNGLDDAPLTIQARRPRRVQRRPARGSRLPSRCLKSDADSMETGERIAPAAGGAWVVALRDGSVVAVR
jgi:hypothetical protein